MAIETGKIHKRRILSDLNHTDVDKRLTGRTVPRREEVARGYHAEVDWAGMVWIPDSIVLRVFVMLQWTDRGQTPGVQQV